MNDDGRDPGSLMLDAYSENSVRVLRFMAENGPVSKLPEIAKALDLPISDVEAAINELLVRGLAEADGVKH